MSLVTRDTRLRPIDEECAYRTRIAHSLTLAPPLPPLQFFKKGKLYTARVIMLGAFAAVVVVIKFQPSSAQRGREGGREAVLRLEKRPSEE